MKVDELIFDQDLLNLYHYMSSVRPSLLAHGNYAVFVHRRNRLVVMMLYDIYIYIYRTVVSLYDMCRKWLPNVCEFCDTRPREIRPFLRGVNAITLAVCRKHVMTVITQRTLWQSLFSTSRNALISTFHFNVIHTPATDYIYIYIYIVFDPLNFTISNK